MLPATNRGAGGTFAFPDVCLTPAAPSPLPIPYPNFGFTMMSVPFSPNVFITFVPAINMATALMLTCGDEGGVAHPTFKGAARFTMGNPIVSIHMLPAIMLCALSNGNNFNAPLGATLIPSITTVFFTRREAELADTDVTASNPLRGTLKVNEIDSSTPSTLCSLLRDNGGRGVVLDLRGCPGGSADAALQLADDFLPDGVTLALRTDADGDVMRCVGRRRQAYAMPLAVLVDEMTASAAEILAGALKFYGRAKLFGATTYGKATTARVMARPEGTQMTEAGTFALPDGAAIQGRGIAPDVVTSAPEEAAWAWLEQST